MGNLASLAAQQYACEREQYPAVQHFEERAVGFRIVAGDGCWGAQVVLPYPARDAQYTRPEGFYVVPRDKLLLVQPLATSLHYTPHADVKAAAELVAATQHQVPPLRVADIVAGLQDDADGAYTPPPPEAWRTELFRPRAAAVSPPPVPAAAKVAAAPPTLGDRMLAVLRELKTVPDPDLPAFAGWCADNCLPLFGLSAGDMRGLSSAFSRPG